MDRLIAFLTDYGTRDGFVAACHGVMAGIAPGHRVIDITHDVPPFNVRHGAVVLAQTMPYLPPAVVVGVVDPGVGSSRRRIALATRRHLFVGPDNGLLVWAADAVGGAERVFELTERTFWRETGAVTFDGRDVFAPVGAHLAAGVVPAVVGDEIDTADVVRIPQPLRDIGDESITTEVLITDWFGNVVLAIRAEDLESAGLADAEHLTVATRNRKVDVILGRSFSDVDEGELLVYVDAAGHAALAANQGSAADILGLAEGDRVTLSVVRA